MGAAVARVILLAVAGILVGGCAGRGAQSGPRFASVLLITDSQDSKTEKTVFAPNTPRIYVLFTLAGVPAGTVIKSVWLAEKTGVTEPNTTLDEATLTMGGAQTSGSFWYSRPTNGWPPGEYRVGLYIGERQTETRRFRIEGQASSPATPAVPFASKGWAFEGGVYVNQRHGLRIAVPAGWRTGDEARFSERILWVMSKLDGAGRERLGVNITHTAIGQKSAEEFFNDDLQEFRQATYEEGGQTKPLFTVLETGKIGTDPGVHYIRNSDQSRGLSLYSAREHRPPPPPRRRPRVLRERSASTRSSLPRPWRAARPWARPARSPPGHAGSTPTFDTRSFGPRIALRARGSRTNGNSCGGRRRSPRPWAATRPLQERSGSGWSGGRARRPDHIASSCASTAARYAREHFRLRPNLLTDQAPGDTQGFAAGRQARIALEGLGECSNCT